MILGVHAILARHLLDTEGIVPLALSGHLHHGKGLTQDLFHRKTGGTIEDGLTRGLPPIVIQGVRAQKIIQGSITEKGRHPTASNR